MKHELLRKNLIWWVAAAALFVGCGKAEPPVFRLNRMQAVSVATPISPESQQEIVDVLNALFGTPDNPLALPETGLDLSRLQMAAGAVWSDKKGLYRRHCVRCHGMTGDGRGATARFLNPYPRDFRPAIYKFKSTYHANRPTDDDLHRILENGMPGTAMPSFSLLPFSERVALVEYVKYLSMRGQLETELIRYVFDELGEEAEVDESGEERVNSDGSVIMKHIAFDPANESEQHDKVMGFLADIVDDWDPAAEKMVTPDEDKIPADNRTAEEIVVSIEKGRKLFFGKRVNCVGCHGPKALGDERLDDHDNWNKSHKKFLTELASVAKGDLQDVDPLLSASRHEVAASIFPVRNAIPRNLWQGVYHGGRRRLDIFWRIYAGIAGTPMPATGPVSPGAKGALSEEEIWSLVDYVLSLPYETPDRRDSFLAAKATEELSLEDNERQAD